MRLRPDGRVLNIIIRIFFSPGNVETLRVFEWEGSVI